MRTVEKKGKSVDEAIEVALSELACSRDEATVEVLDEPEKGFLGIFAGKLARVRVSCPDAPAEDEDEPQPGASGLHPPVARTSSPEPPEDEARRLVETILNKMELAYTIDTVSADGERIRINFVGADMGLLIGRKGETLNALQLLLGLIYNRTADKKYRIVLDVENYRLNREQSLEALALRMADKVRQTKKSVILRPMNAQERRIVHTALQQETMVTTYSVGDDPNRKVVIAIKK